VKRGVSGAPWLLLYGASQNGGALVVPSKSLHQWQAVKEEDTAKNECLLKTNKSSPMEPEGHLSNKHNKESETDTRTKDTEGSLKKHKGIQIT